MRKQQIEEPLLKMQTGAPNCNN